MFGAAKGHFLIKHAECKKDSEACMLKRLMYLVEVRTAHLLALTWGVVRGLFRLVSSLPMPLIDLS